MTPVVEKNGKLFMVVGTPGGSTIITSVLQTILNVSEFNMSMQEAVNAPRFHHQWLPDEITFEPDSLQRLTGKSKSKRIQN
jgi:gamma-glutamyltranspeptidase/glutathione hydrolase